MGDLYHRTIEIQLSAAVECDEDAEKLLDEVEEKIRTSENIYAGNYSFKVWNMAVGEIAGTIKAYDKKREEYDVGVRKGYKEE